GPDPAQPRPDHPDGPTALRQGRHHAYDLATRPLAPRGDRGPLSHPARTRVEIPGGADSPGQRRRRRHPEDGRAPGQPQAASPPGLRESSRSKFRPSTPTVRSSPRRPRGSHAGTSSCCRHGWPWDWAGIDQETPTLGSGACRRRDPFSLGREPGSFIIQRGKPRSSSGKQQWHLPNEYPGELDRMNGDLQEGGGSAMRIARAARPAGTVVLTLVVLLGLPAFVQAGKLSWLDDVVQEVITEAKAGSKAMARGAGGDAALAEVRGAG